MNQFQTIFNRRLERRNAVALLGVRTKLSCVMYGNGDYSTGDSNG